MNVLTIALSCGVLALLYGLWASRSVLAADAGSERMREIAGAIQEGAKAYLNRQYSTIAIVGVIVAIVLGVTLGLYVAIGFLIGAVLSGVAGYIGMNVSVRANVRTTQAALASLAEALGIAFKSGAVTGMLVVGLGLLGVAGYYAILRALGVDQRTLIEALVALSFGASLISIFARLGGGIFTKGADVGADLVGKVEAGIPEDDPRNAAVIADNVGDNVGDCAGMAADLFETYAVTLVATMLLATISFSGDQVLARLELPMLIGAVCIVASIVGAFFVRLGKSQSIMGALYKGFIASAVLSAILIYAVTQWQFGAAGLTYFLCALVGLAVTGTIIWVTEFYTGTNYRPGALGGPRFRKPATQPTSSKGLPCRWKRRRCRPSSSPSASPQPSGLAVSTALPSPPPPCWPWPGWWSRSTPTARSRTTPAASRRWQSSMKTCARPPTPWTRWATPPRRSPRAMPSARRGWRRSCCSPPTPTTWSTSSPIST